MYCKDCGNKFEGGNYCPECGNEIKKIEGEKWYSFRKNLPLIGILFIMIIIGVLAQWIMG